MTNCYGFARKRTTIHPTIRVLKNKITKARVIHELRCGCLIDAGQTYHCVVALVNSTFTVTKQHDGLGQGCMETAH